MEINKPIKLTGADYQELGLFLRGLIQIMAADGHLHEQQKNHILDFGTETGFARGFLLESIEGALNNKHLPKEPPIFSHPESAAKFLSKAAVIAVSDGELHPREKKWLLKTAEINNIDTDDIQQILASVPEKIE
ncbi:MAG: TerB family tellurite resistance protein [Leptospiraceae bacterium]|nr:TerB family tellurite resistance protein [Leptospiraceae bacterium]